MGAVWEGRWAGGRRRRLTNGRTVWMLERVVRGERFAITLNAKTEAEAIGLLRSFELEHALEPSVPEVPRANRRREGAGLVYFVRCGGAIKIGFTTDLEQRMAALRSLSAEGLFALGMLPGSRETEQRLHRQFKELRMHGEWFRAAPELLDFIDLTQRELAA